MFLWDSPSCLPFNSVSYPQTLSIRRGPYLFTWGRGLLHQNYFSVAGNQMLLTDAGTTELPFLRQVSRQGGGDSRAAQCGITRSLLADHTLFSQSRRYVWCGDAAVSKAAGRDRMKRFQYSKVGITTGSVGPCGNTDEGPLTQRGGLRCQ